jgi:nitric oxide reductase subunit B
MSLLPYGLIQVHAAVSEGFWYARSAELLQQPLMQLLVWLRMPGDIVFSIGVLLLAVFVAKLWLGGGRRQEIELPATAQTVRSSGR